MGIFGGGIVTPQKRENIMRRKGVKRDAVYDDGVIAEIAWPRRTENCSVR